MPTILRLDGYRFYFYSHEPNEPPHVHVDKGGASIKVWLDPISLARNTGFRRQEINGIITMVEAHRARLLEAWHEYFG
ncbi:DUF4160 domain-containing protein [Sphingobium yanoikuyae]|jgi:hypothetical protein|uniref:DUF4160 domain-containing protein n=1 Tax=Sphingobium yanoikuyae TaxID=13690 RepID=A0A0J9D769_SPHYA|nr:MULTISPECIES: DUF4160 domain-containing protein [Sphingobium]ATP17411.1 hypothetical protein BV87_02755 [Sphingobium yanoikuyae]KMW32336.1 hypothetical protein BV87_13670 [Sphingobium yanoikuyae]MDH2130162.1 DUF4160 domain-containing protein [Sphingobium yanoikuyae]MDH2148093.1 DUF4160 domain-containing protein [Sphingobium yanoikuyae]MDH2165689.1 DUF4160 domain-containing protein [Sphingobium yanoikuyae]